MRQAAKRRSAAEWSDLVGQWRSSGQRARAFAAEHGVRVGTLSWWSWKLGPRSTGRGSRTQPRAGAQHGSAFTEVRLVSSSPTGATVGSVEIHAQSGLVVRVQGTVDPALLVNVLRAVSQC